MIEPSVALLRFGTPFQKHTRRMRNRFHNSHQAQFAGIIEFSSGQAGGGGGASGASGPPTYSWQATSGSGSTSGSQSTFAGYSGGGDYSQFASPDRDVGY